MSIILTFLATAGSISVTEGASQLWLHSTNTQGEPTTRLIQGNITAAIRHKPFGGEAIGAYSVFLSGQKVEINIYLHKLPEPGNIFEARLVDTNTNSTLSLGQVGTNSTLPVNQNIMSLFAYNEIIIITRQAAANNASDSKHSHTVGGAALQAPFGNNFIY